MAMLSVTVTLSRKIALIVPWRGNPRLVYLLEVVQIQKEA
jgi:hypothetical protein